VDQRQVVSNVPAISRGGVPVDPRFLGGQQQTTQGLGLASAVQVVPRIILGQEVEGNEGGIVSQWELHEASAAMQG